MQTNLSGKAVKIVRGAAVLIDASNPLLGPAFTNPAPEVAVVSPVLETPSERAKRLLGPLFSEGL